MQHCIQASAADQERVDRHVDVGGALPSHGGSFACRNAGYRPLRKAARQTGRGGAGAAGRPRLQPTGWPWGPGRVSAEVGPATRRADCRDGFQARPRAQARGDPGRDPGTGSGAGGPGDPTGDRWRRTGRVRDPAGGRESQQGTVRPPRGPYRGNGRPASGLWHGGRGPGHGRIGTARARLRQAPGGAGRKGVLAIADAGFAPGLPVAWLVWDWPGSLRGAG